MERSEQTERSFVSEDSVISRRRKSVKRCSSTWRVNGGCEENAMNSLQECMKPRLLRMMRISRSFWMSGDAAGS